jgi:hypothetical protein
MVRFRSIRRRFLRLAQVGNQRRALLAEAVLGLLVARFLLSFVSFPQLARRFGTLVTPTDRHISSTTHSNPEQQIWIAKEVSWAVTCAARYVPFKAVCLPQAMAARAMLKRRGIASVMHFGAARGQTRPLDSHAWLDAAGVEVTGYPVEEHLAEIGCFI